MNSWTTSALTLLPKINLRRHKETIRVINAVYESIAAGDVVSKTDIATEYMFKGISWLAKTMECLFGGFFEASVYSIYQL